MTMSHILSGTGPQPMQTVPDHPTTPPYLSVSVNFQATPVPPSTPFATHSPPVHLSAMPVSTAMPTAAPPPPSKPVPQSPPTLQADDTFQSFHQWRWKWHNFSVMIDLQKLS
ncbi:hypothetical protein SK128_000939 [Halocaridina rubra]|uniref:Uncharacterized protein n=1 Tax=Halocaridina rubra TaxID=373956 RepID=A0AAN8WZM3_HALRR